MKQLLVSNAGSVGGGVLAVLARAGYVLHGVDLMPAVGRLWSRHLRSFTYVGAAEADACCRELQAVAERLGVDGFFPVGLRFSYAAARLGWRGPGMEAFWEAATKARCLRACREAGIPAPAVYEWNEARARAERETLVVKPGWDAGNAKGVRYVRGWEPLCAAAELCRQEFGSVVIEEYIPGGPEAMRTLTVVCGEGGRVAAAVTMRKVRQIPEEGGVTAVGESTHEPEILEQMRPLFQRWRWCGAAEVELKRDARDGRWQVIEVNPRWPGYLAFLAEIHPEMMLAAARVALGEDVAEEPYPAYEAGRVYAAAGKLGWGAWRWPGAAWRGLAQALADPLPELNRVWQGRRGMGPWFDVREDG